MEEKRREILVKFFFIKRDNYNHIYCALSFVAIYSFILKRKNKTNKVLYSFKLSMRCDGDEHLSALTKHLSNT